MKWVNSLVRKPTRYQQYLIRGTVDSFWATYDPNGFRSQGGGYYIDPVYWLDPTNQNVLEADEDKPTARQIAEKYGIGDAIDLIEKAILEYRP